MNADRLMVVALGSNLGDSVAVLNRAIDRLRALAAGSFKASSIWRTKPEHCPPNSPDFLNAVVVFEGRPETGPFEILRILKAWEIEFGRLPKLVSNEARHLDLDLIGFGGQQIATAELTLPHPRAHRRAFVLAPLAELLPDLILPGWDESVRALLAKSEGVDQVELSRSSPGS